MISEETLRIVINENSLVKNNNSTIKRDYDIPLEANTIIVVSGVRRCGKSTLLKTELQNVKDKISLNFEDTRLDGFEISDFLKIEKIANSLGTKCLVFDEIQNIAGWEKYVRSAHDKGFRIYITGSNASMLSRELGTKLTGRYKQTELYPFNYNEFLLYTGKAEGEQSLRDFLQSGGFPEFLANLDTEYLRTLLRDIVIRDIAVRRNIKNDHMILRLALNLLSNVGKQISFNNIAKMLEIKSVRSVIDYCNYLKESYLFDFIPRFSFSIKQQMNNPKKVYCIDSGMARANSLSFSEDFGRMLENAIFIRLRQFSPDILYFNDHQSECDFLVRKNERIVYALQVCWHLSEENLQREIFGLKSAMKATGTTTGIIVTFNQEDTFGEIKAIPAWKWFQSEVVL